MVVGDDETIGRNEEPGTERDAILRCRLLGRRAILFREALEEFPQLRRQGIERARLPGAIAAPSTTTRTETTAGRTRSASGAKDGVKGARRSEVKIGAAWPWLEPTK